MVVKTIHKETDSSGDIATLISNAISKGEHAIAAARYIDVYPSCGTPYIQVTMNDYSGYYIHVSKMANAGELLEDETS